MCLLGGAGRLFVSTPVHHEVSSRPAGEFHSFRSRKGSDDGREVGTGLKKGK